VEAGWRRERALPLSWSSPELAPQFIA